MKEARHVGLFLNVASRGSKRALLPYCSRREILQLWEYFKQFSPKPLISYNATHAQRQRPRASYPTALSRRIESHPPTIEQHRSTGSTMASDLSTFHYPHRTSSSSYRVPTPPRIVVPPPALNSDALPEITLNALKESSFVNNVNYHNIVTQNALLEWTYERRREAQMILPYLYLGPMTAAKDEAWLRREGITCILGVRQKGAFESRLMNGALRKAAELGIEHYTVDLTGNQELIHSFPATTAQIYEHVSQKLQQTGQMGKVLIFCESGNERSAGVVAAYLMETHEDVDYIKAMQLCQAQRFCVNFDDGMKRLLQGYWDILRAKREVAAQGHGIPQPNGATSPTPTSAKRGLERDEDEDMEGVDEDDLERFDGRTFAPFVDQPL